MDDLVKRLLPPHRRLIGEDDAIKTAWMILTGLGYRREVNPQLERTVREVFATAPAIEVEECLAWLKKDGDPEAESKDCIAYGSPVWEERHAGNHRPC